jgi:hypothetical protein
MENRHGLVVDGTLTLAGTTEREAAPIRAAARHSGGDKAYDARQFIADLRARHITPHVAVDGHVRKSGKPARHSYRAAHHSSLRVRHRPAMPKARRGVRLDQGRRRSDQNKLCGSWRSVSCTRSASPSNPLRMSVRSVASHTRRPLGTGIIDVAPRQL